MKTAHQILEAAGAHLNGRSSTYDKPQGERSMRQTVEVFNAYHGTRLTEAQGYHFLQVLKDVRFFTRPQPHLDSGEDGVAYSALKVEAALASGHVKNPEAPGQGVSQPAAAKSNFRRTADWLSACGKTPSAKAASVQIGVHIEEFAEFLRSLDVASTEPGGAPWYDESQRLCSSLNHLASRIKQGSLLVIVQPGRRVEALDALCDSEVTGNGVAYLLGMNKEGADVAVLDSNDAKLVDGKPVLLPGGKIGKPDGWKAPDLGSFV